MVYGRKIDSYEMGGGRVEEGEGGVDSRHDDDADELRSPFDETASHDGSERVDRTSVPAALRQGADPNFTTSTRHAIDARRAGRAGQAGQARHGGRRRRNDDDDRSNSQ